MRARRGASSALDAADNDSERSYRLILTSVKAFNFPTLESEIGATNPAEPVVIEFIAVPLGKDFPWSRLEAIGVQGPVSLKSGRCESAA